MAINLSGIGLSGTAAGTAREAQETQQPAVATPDAGQDAAAPRPGEVSITSTAALLARLEQALGKHAPVDQKRVDSISRAIADGSYKVDSAKVASGLMQSERSLAPLPLTEI
jgi:negative regulator of flagellin synthesis FlgM